MADPRDSRGALVRRAVIADSPAIRRIRNAAIRDSLAIWTEREQDPRTVEGLRQDSGAPVPGRRASALRVAASLGV